MALDDASNNEQHWDDPAYTGVGFSAVSELDLQLRVQGAQPPVRQSVPSLPAIQAVRSDALRTLET